MFGGTSYSVTPQKRTNITSSLIRDVKRRSFRLSRTPRVALTDTSVMSEKNTRPENRPRDIHSSSPGIAAIIC